MPFDGTELKPHVLLLMQARERISDENNWCKRSYKNGHKVCMLGAFGLSYFTEIEPDVETALCVLDRTCDDNITAFNDSHTHAEVLAAFDRAIELANAGGSVQRDAEAALYALSESCGGAFARFNDTHTHAEVLAAFDRAIELASA